MSLYTSPESGALGGGNIGVSEYYTLYEKDYIELYKSVNANLSNINYLLNSNKAIEPEKFDKLSQDLQDAQTCIIQMESEVKSLPNSFNYINIVARYRNELKDMRNLYQRYKETTERRSLVYPRSDYPSTVGRGSNSGSNNGVYSGAYGTERMIKTSMALHEGTQALHESNRVAAESEALGLTIMGELRGQRDTVIRSQQMATESNSSLASTTPMLRRMRRRLVLNKIILYAAIAVLLLAIVLLLYIRITKALKG